MTRKTCFTVIALSFLLTGSYKSPAQVGMAQTSSISGVVTDSITGQPVADVIVFIPSTTIGTSTNSKGEYFLSKLPAGDQKLLFRHLSYEPSEYLITVIPGTHTRLNVRIAGKTVALSEVVIKGEIPNWEKSFNIFKEYFLGDPFETKCFLENQKDLKFYYQGDILIGYAQKPLKIVNRQLGYRITYFLDYFKFEQAPPQRLYGFKKSSYSYSGSTLFENLKSVIPLSGLNWEKNREAEFHGSLRHFLMMLNQNKLAANGYFLRKTLPAKAEIQPGENLNAGSGGTSQAKRDSIFAWFPGKKESEYVYFSPDEEYRIPDSLITEGPSEGIKTLALNGWLLVFKHPDKGQDRSEVTRWAISSTTGKIIFDWEGNFQVPGGTLEWVILDQAYRVRKMLPTDYLPKGIQ